MARNLIDNIEEYTTRNIKQLQERRKQQQQAEADAAAAIAAATAAAELDKEDEPPPRTAAELEEEERLISALKTEPSEPPEDPFSSEDIIDNPKATPGKNLEKALDSLILITKGSESADDNDATVDDDPVGDPTTTTQQKSLSFDLLSDSSGNDSTAPLLELTPSHSNSITDNTLSDSPTLPDLLGESPPKNQEFSQGNSIISQHQQTNNTDLNTTPDLMLGDNLTSAEMPLDIASNVTYPPLDLLSNEEASGQLVDVTQGTNEGDLLLANEAPMDSHNSNPTPGKHGNILTLKYPMLLLLNNHLSCDIAYNIPSF